MLLLRADSSSNSIKTAIVSLDDIREESIKLTGRSSSRNGRVIDDAESKINSRLSSSDNSLGSRDTAVLIAAGP